MVRARQAHEGDPELVPQVLVYLKQSPCASFGVEVITLHDHSHIDSLTVEAHGRDNHFRERSGGHQPCVQTMTRC